jgi:hypothetical protein
MENERKPNKEVVVDHIRLDIGVREKRLPFLVE